jgi:glycosyltransferase involved in cell wall biosynthesis
MRHPPETHKHVPDQPHPWVSVIVPVFNDRERLRQCLAALENQRYPKMCYEVIVVDNGSAPPIERDPAHQHVITIHHSSPGSYAARNAGIRIARGSVVAFTDADCIPARDWLQNAVTSLAGLPRRTILAGHIERRISRSGRPSPIEVYDQTFFLRQDLCVARGFAVTANIVTTVEAFRSIGLFNDRFTSGGDVEWTVRARNLGFTIRYGAQRHCMAPDHHHAIGPDQEVAESDGRKRQIQYSTRYAADLPGSGP